MCVSDFHVVCLQMFDSNVSKDKLLRMKLGSGKVIKVSMNQSCHRLDNYGVDCVFIKNSLSLCMCGSGLGGGHAEHA